MAAVEVRGEREAGLLRGFDEAMGQRQDGAVVLDPQRAALAAVLRLAALHVVLRSRKNGSTSSNVQPRQPICAQPS